MRGSITVRPPLGKQEIESTYTDVGDLFSYVVPNIETHSTDESPDLSVSQCFELKPGEDELVSWRVRDELAKIFSAFPDNDFNGYFECWGEDFDDLFRIEVKESKVKIVWPTITWPS
ncbi:hypothetical protein [Rhodococcus qingshengii]|uniref:hypothetical protein n=1 Tax=Rhodococcus qingshengii TaxID=334542 RepID=UPI0035DA8D3C